MSHRIVVMIVATLTFAACASVTDSSDVADGPGSVSDTSPQQPSETSVPVVDSTPIGSLSSSAPPSSTTTAVTTTVAPTTVISTTVAPTTVVESTTTTTTTTAAAPATAPPTTILALAPCVRGEITLFTTGRRDEIALYQQTLTDLGYAPGAIDGYYGQNTYSAAIEEISDNGNVNGPNGFFEEVFPDDGAVLPAAFERLGIGCGSLGVDL